MIFSLGDEELQTVAWREMKRNPRDREREIMNTEWRWIFNFGIVIGL
jgi:hypothetical protein